MTFKHVLVLAILTIASTSSVLGNNLTLGSRLPNDYVIRNVSISRPPSKHAQKLIIPIADRSNISSIDVLDRNSTSNQSASIILGGVGHRLAILYLNSPPRRSLNFTVIARGVRPPPPPPKPVPPPPPPHQRPPPPPPHERPPPPPPAHRSPPPPPPSDEDQYNDVFEFDDQFF